MLGVRVCRWLCGCQPEQGQCGCTHKYGLQCMQAVLVESTDLVGMHSATACADFVHNKPLHERPHIACQQSNPALPAGMFHPLIVQLCTPRSEKPRPCPCDRPTWLTTSCTKQVLLNRLATSRAATSTNSEGKVGWLRGAGSVCLVAQKHESGLHCVCSEPGTPEP